LVKIKNLIAHYLLYMKDLKPDISKLAIKLLKKGGIVLIIWSAIYYYNVCKKNGTIDFTAYLYTVMFPCAILIFFSIIVSYVLFCPKVTYDKHYITLKNRIGITKKFQWRDLIYFKNDYMGFLMEFIPDKKFQIMGIAYSNDTWDEFLEFLNKNIPNKRIYSNEFPGGGL